MKRKKYGCEIELSVETLSFKHKKYLKAFSCGKESLDEYFKTKALDDEDATTHIFIDKEAKKPIALVSLSCSGIMLNSSTKFYIYPAVEIKMFALNEEYKNLKYSNEKNDNEKLSDKIFNYIIFKLICDFTDNYCGAGRIVLYSLPDKVSFYKDRHNFCDFVELMYPNDEMYLKDCVPLYFKY